MVAVVQREVLSAATPFASLGGGRLRASPSAIPAAVKICGVWLEVLAWAIIEPLVDDLSFARVSGANRATLQIGRAHV